MYEGQSKFPGVGILRCNVRTYGNVYLITYTVGPLCTHTHFLIDPVIVQNTAQAFCCNLSEFSPRIPFYVLYGGKGCPLEAHFQNREQPKVTQSEIRRASWLGADRNWCTTSHMCLGAASSAKFALKNEQ
jgi:hypothetical protein